MPQSLTCPKCNAPIPFQENAGATLTCPFCGNVVATPADWRAAPDLPALAQAGDLGGMLQQALQMAPQLKEIAELARTGNKLEAIKQYRALTGLGLKEAKDAVEQMAAGQVAIQFNTFSTASADADADPTRWAEIKALLQRGNKIEAIKRFREMTGVGLKEAKDAVEQMDAHRDFDEAALNIARAPSTFSIPPSNTLKYPQSPSVVEPEGNTGRGCVVWGVVIAFVALAMMGAGAVLLFALLR